MFNIGIVYAILSAFMFSIMYIFTKMLSASMGSGEIVFFRSVIGFIFIQCIMLKLGYHYAKKDITDLIMRGIFGGLAMSFLFCAISSGMPLGDVSILAKLSSFFVLLISIFYLHEKFPRNAVLPIVAIIAGISLVLRPWEFNSFSFYALLAIASAFCTAIVNTTIHQLYKKGGHNAWEIISYLFIFSTLFGAVQMYGHFHRPDNTEWALLLGVALSSLLAQAFMTQAYGLTNQVLVSFVMYLGVFLNILWGRVFFGEPILVSSLCGGALIILSSLYLSITQKNKAE